MEWNLFFWDVDEICHVCNGTGVEPTTKNESSPFEDEGRGVGGDE